MRTTTIGKGAIFLDVLVSLLALLSSQAMAQQPYPSRPVRILVGFGAGGATDIVARVLGAKLADSLGQQFYVENRGGAGGTIATEMAARAEPDGHTLLMVPFANAVNETLFKAFNVKMGEHLVAVAPVADTTNVLVVHPSLPVRSVGDLVALAKTLPPGTLVSASSGRGTAVHLSTELFNMMTGVKITSLHYKGGGDVTRDLVTGEVKIMFATIAPILEFIRNGSVRAIATTGLKRDRSLPELPTVAEQGLPDFDVRVWIGLAAPAGTPRPVIDRLALATAQALETEQVKAAFTGQGFDPLKGTPEDFAALYAREVETWRNVIQTAGITNE